MTDNERHAFILRVAPGGNDRVLEALNEDQIIIGWAEGKRLLDQALSWEEFRDIISAVFYPKEDNLRRAGAAAGHVWRFIREMQDGDLVVVPHGPDFYVAEIRGPAIYDDTKVSDETAYRRPVRWLNEKRRIPRSHARSALISRMKTYGTCARATDIINDIDECVRFAEKGESPSFQSDLRVRLVKETLEELRKGRMESFGFERMIQDVLYGLGAKEAWRVPRKQDQGADVIATFLVAGAIQQVVAVQAKHWQPEPPVKGEVVEQLIKGIEAESADLGMVVTSGTISDDAVEVAENYYQEKGVKIELVDGEHFAALMVEHGIPLARPHTSFQSVISN